ncbi:MAG: hypothetical protein QOH75_3437 [Actinomycetota bacterium]|jgi:Flp pilus assembly pilin Flp|nr:hypothetical protein [Actinomycetota bacterium]
MPRRSLRDAGATAVEYALIVAAIALILIPVVISLNKVLDDTLHRSCESTAKQNAATPMSDAEAKAACK